MVALTGKPKMEKDFEPGDSANLPRVDCFTTAIYLATMNKIIPENNAKTDCYGDDAIGYVQLCRKEGLCKLKAMVSPQPKVNINVTLIFNEMTEEILHTECHDCEAPQTGCMHGAAFLLWLHRRSEEPSFPNRESYWRRPKIAQDENELKFITAKQLSRKKRRIPEIETNQSFVSEFLSEAKKRNLDGPLIRLNPNQLLLRMRCPAHLGHWYLSAKEGTDKS